MKKLMLVAALTLSLSVVAQEKPKKQYRSAETGRYVTKTTAEKKPATTYSTTRTRSTSTTTTAPKATRSTSSKRKS